MMSEHYEIEAFTPFSESKIWQLNRDFYHERGISAWSEGVVPHQMTSNSRVGKTYAELIFGLLQDIAQKGNLEEVVYILELGAGHGRLAFHILKHLELRIAQAQEVLPPFCYILSDIVEANLSFFQKHPQLQSYLEKGVLDFAFFDGPISEEIQLRNAQRTLSPQQLKQPIVAIGNYFFDSLPNELFYLQNQEISSSAVAIDSRENPKGLDTEKLIDNLEFTYFNTITDQPIDEDPILNEILEDYRGIFDQTYLFFPKKAMQCLAHIKSLSKSGLVLLTMDKGFHELAKLEAKKEPEFITHGSFSLWVNYHALGAFCTKQGGKVLFPAFSNFHLEIGCLLFLEEGDSYQKLAAAYQESVDLFGPDDFNTLKQLSYFNVSRIKLVELIALYRLSAYDSTFFIKLLPRLKQVYQSITFQERERLGQTLERIWDMYFNINEAHDLAYEIGGILYDLAYYQEALIYFQHSVDHFGTKPDVYYNQALCYYQLRQDKLFYQTIANGKASYPNFERFQHLDKLDMNA